jgi:hypothetical protein
VVEAAQAAADAVRSRSAIGLRDNGNVPVICLTCQNVFRGQIIHAGDPILLCMGLFLIFCPSGWQSRFDAGKAGRAGRFGASAVWISCRQGRNAGGSAHEEKVTLQCGLCS